MSRLLGAVRRYPLVALTVVIGAVAVALLLSGAEHAAQLLASVYALGIAAFESVRMVRSLLAKRLGLDILAVTAIVSTVVVGEYLASLVIVLMLTGGEALESIAAGRARRELRALLDHAPVSAHRLTADGVPEDIPVDAVVPGDRLLVRPGEVMPVDARLLSLDATVDESALTGESVPVERSRGETVLSGAVNGAGAIEVEALAAAVDSQYQRIIALVREASESKAPLVRLADRYALPFTALALGIAALAWALSGDPVRFAEVLVVATPCPLLIAAPVAFLGGMSSAAKRGIVMKSAGSLEVLARVRTAAFDKTGTLTRGRPEVVAVEPAAGFEADELLRLVGSAEQYSSHVLALSLQQAALSRGLALSSSTDAHEVATHGVVATLEGRQVAVGKPAFIAELAPDTRRRAAVSGEAVVYVAIDGACAGYIVLRDALRPEAASTVDALRTLGVQRTVLITGDVETVARPIADALGVAEVHAECLPADKVRIVGEAEPRPVLMVGDGINDAPVLAAAEVGIAMGARGATAAGEAAAVVVLVDDISAVARAVAIGQRTVRIALQSIWLGIVISVVLMIIASMGVLPAIIGAALQEVVDLVAILAALRAVRAGVAPVAGLDDRSADTTTGPELVGSGPVVHEG